MLSAWSLAVLDSMLPVVGHCAHLGVRVDTPLRREMREGVAAKHAALLTEFNAEIAGFAAVKAEQLDDELTLACERRDFYRRHAKGRSLFDDEPEIDVNEAHALWQEWKARAEKARADLKRYENVGPTKKDIIREFFFSDPAGLRLKPNKRTPSGKEAIGRKELSALIKRADVRAKLVKDTRFKALAIFSEVERLRAVAALHLGIGSEDGKMDLRVDTQLHKGRLAVVYNPVRMRFSSGASDEKPHPHAIQMHNPPKVLTAGEEVWPIREQFLPDRDDQLMAKFDWKGFEGFVMAWQAGARIGYWEWLRRLYDGIDNHCATACIIEPSLPKGECRGEEKCVHRTTLIDMGGIMRPARDGGKQINHAYTLGGRENFLKENYGVPFAKARVMLGRMDSSAHGQAVKALHEHIEDEAVRTGQVTTPFGEYCDFWGYERKGTRMVPRAPRECYAVAQQGTAAIIMQSRMGPVDKAARECGGRFVLQVHDEYVVCIQQDSAAVAVKAICGIMAEPVEQMPVPFNGGLGLSIPVDVAVGKSWGAAK